MLVFNCFVFCIFMKERKKSLVFAYLNIVTEKVLSGVKLFVLCNLI